MSGNQSLYLNAAEELLVDAIEFGKIKVGAVGNRSMPINNKKGKPIMIKMPAMLTWGIDIREFDGKRKPPSMNLQFSTDPKYRMEGHEFALDNLKQLETEVKKQVFANAKECLNKTVKSLDVIDALFNPMLRYSKNKETNEPDLTRAPTLTVKIPDWGGEISVDIFNTEGAHVFPSGSTQLEDVIVKKCTVECLLQCGGIWFAGNGSFGVTWRLKQCVVHEPRGGVPRGVCVIGGAPEGGGAAKPKPAPAMAESFFAAEESGSLEVLSDDELEDASTMHAAVDAAAAGEEAPGDAPVKGRKKVVKK